MTDAVRGPRGRTSGGADPPQAGRAIVEPRGSRPSGKGSGRGQTRREATPIPDPVPPVFEGQVIAGKYLIEQFIGQGGMGVVVSATHLQLEQRVALKFLYRGGQNEEIVERFIREARAAAKIQSEHVGRVIDVGALPSGEPFMVMEHLEGRDLSAVLLTEGALPVARAVDYVLQACEAIAEAHAFGIVHRDLKPANLFLARRLDGSQRIKVLDFGISKLMTSHDSLEHTDPALTNPSAVMGSPLYMSPEQMHASMHVDARSDVWAIGVILYELMTTATPFEAESIPLIHAAVLHDPPRPLAELLPDAPDGLEAAIFRCLEKDPAKRYADMAELVTTLAPFCPRRGRITTERVARLFAATRASSDRPPPSLRPMLPDPGEPASTITSWGEEKKRSEPPVAAPLAPPRGVSRAQVALVVAVLLAGAGGAFAVTKRLGRAPTAPIAATTASPTPAAPAAEPNTAAAVAADPSPTPASGSASPASPSTAASAVVPKASPSRRTPPPRPPSTSADTKPAPTTSPTSNGGPAPKPTGTAGFGDRE